MIIKNTFTISLSLVSIMFLSQAYAQLSSTVCQERSSKIVCSAGEIQEVNFLSDVNFEGTIVLGHTKILGDITANHSHFNTLDTIGNINANDIDVVGFAKMLGNLSLSNAIFHAPVNITGDVSVMNTEFKDKTKIVGNLTSVTTHFLNDLKLASFKVELDRGEAINLDFLPSNKPQTLYLTHSMINGNITFSSNNGVVYCDSQSRINGRIIGGSVIHTN